MEPLFVWLCEWRRNRKQAKKDEENARAESDVGFARRFERQMREMGPQGSAKVLDDADAGVIARLAEKLPPL